MKEIISVLNRYVLSIQDIKLVQEDVFKVKTKEGDFCLKRADRRTPKLIFIYSVLMHLVNQGFQKVSAPVPTREGNPFVNSGRHIYFVTKWISGIPCVFERDHHLVASARTLGEFHQLAQGLSVLPGGKARSMYDEWPKKFSERVENLKNFKKEIHQKKILTAFEKRYLEHVDYFIDLGETACKALELSAFREIAKESKERNTFTHRDVADRNFIIGQDGTAFMIDFDYCRYDIRVTDVVRMIERTLKYFKWDMAKAELILENYNGVNPLKTEEYPVMLAFFQFPQKFWRISDRYFRKPRRWQEEGYLKKLVSATGKLEHKEKFINEFKKEYC